MTTLPVLWLYGPSGIGKTTVTWELFVRLFREGVSTGYVDIDQLGMCYARRRRSTGHQRAVAAGFPWPADITERLITSLAHLTGVRPAAPRSPSH
jgi:pantothenate kinase-related protein Tda10